MKVVNALLIIFLCFCFVPCEAFATNDPGKDSTKCYSRFDSLSKREIYFLADTMPQFPGGMKAMMAFISRNLIYPRHIDCSNFTLYMTFVVEVDGTLTNKKILNSYNGMGDQEALSVMEKMPIWKPGCCNGTPVPVRINIPIRFKFH